MIPLRDAIRSKNFPAVNVLIIVLNILAFLWELAQGPDLQDLFYLYGIVPLRYSNPEIAAHFTSFRANSPFFDLHVSSRRVPPYHHEHVVSLYLRR